jgi:hypothetical protein
MPENEKYFNVEKLVDEVLKKDPGFSLPDNFAEMVAEKVDRRFAWNQYLEEFFVYLSVFVAIGLGIAGISLFWLDADWKSWLDFGLANTGLIAGIGIILVFVLFADRVVLRYFLFRSKQEEA